MSVGKGPNKTGSLFVAPIDCAACASGQSPTNPYTINDGKPANDFRITASPGAGEMELGAASLPMMPNS